MMGMSLAAASANAGYSCKSFDGKVSLSLYHDFGLKVSVREEQGVETLFYAQLTAREDSFFYSKEEYDLHTPTRLAEEAKLKVVSQIGECGRGACEETGSRIITAKLKHHEAETNFHCFATDH